MALTAVLGHLRGPLRVFILFNLAAIPKVPSRLSIKFRGRFRSTPWLPHVPANSLATFPWHLPSASQATRNTPSDQGVAVAVTNEVRESAACTLIYIIRCRV